MPMTAPNDWNQKGWASPQELLAAIVMDDRLGDDRPQPRHALGEPDGNATAVKRQVGAAGSFCHAPIWATAEPASRPYRYALRQQRLAFLPLPQGQGSLRPT